MITKFIEVKAQIDMHHFYKNADPKDPINGFLANMHRHIFKVTAVIEVFHDDRELEFFKVKDSLDMWLTQYRKKHNGTDFSCEMVATKLLGNIKLMYPRGFERTIEIKVSEDGECAAIVKYTK